MTSSSHLASLSIGCNAVHGCKQIKKCEFKYIPMVQQLTKFDENLYSHVLLFVSPVRIRGT